MAITTAPKKNLLLRILQIKFARDFRELNINAIRSTSPYAVTDKQPTSRIVDNPITKGSWSISPVKSSVSRGFFGGIKSVSVSGGGGGGSVDTKVQFDEIFMCPVTGREFLTKDLDAYKNKWDNACKQFGEQMAELTEINHSFEKNGDLIKLPDSDKILFIGQEIYMESSYTETVEKIIKSINEEQG